MPVRTTTRRDGHHVWRRAAAIAVAAAALAAAGPGTGPALAVTKPTPRNLAGFAADPATGKLVLFGGFEMTGATNAPVNDTWTWSGKAWKKLSPATSPGGRQGHSMATDKVSRTVVLFGGLAYLSSQTSHATTLAETWTWDGLARTWTEQTPPVSPPQRWAASMAPHPPTGTVVLFGGQPQPLPGAQLGDTWTWDGAAKAWTPQAPAVSPPARSGASMAYDARRKEVVVFGGYGTDGIPLGDTWTWDGTQWTEETPATRPPARASAAMAYDALRQRVVLFGGYVPGFGKNMADDTWTWDGTTWVQQAPLTRPPHRRDASMAYHSGTQKSVLFGGTALINHFFECPAPGPPCSDGIRADDTWTYGTNWKQKT
ncbi:MAG: Kelch repeat-containing protein [Acidimicrobiales bacterium]